MTVKIRPYRKGGWEVDIMIRLDNGQRYRERRKAPVSSKSGALRWGQQRGPHLLARALARSLLCSACALPLLCACHLFEEQAPEAEVDVRAGADPAAYTEEVDAKLRRHSGCRDTVASVMSESWERYVDQVGDDGKPKRRREGVFLRGITANTFRGCRRVIAAHGGAVEMPVIERSTVELVDAASRYAELTRELDDYLDAKAWKDDGWAKLAQLDPPLREAHERWAAADQVLQRAIDLRHLENDQLLLGVLEQRAGRLEFASRKLMVYARPLVRCLEREPSPALSECRPLFDGFDAVTDEFEEVYGADFDADKVFWMSTFANDVEEFHAIAGELVRKLGQRRLRSSDLQALRDAYSSLVRDAETLDFDFP